MEQNRKPRSKPMLLWSVNVRQKRQEYTTGKRQSLQQMVLGKLDSYVPKNETGSKLSYTIYKNKLKMG